MHSFYGYNVDGVLVKSYDNCQKDFENNEKIDRTEMVYNAIKDLITTAPKPTEVKEISGRNTMLFTIQPKTEGQKVTYDKQISIKGIPTGLYKIFITSRPISEESTKTNETLIGGTINITASESEKTQSHHMSSRFIDKQIWYESTLPITINNTDQITIIYNSDITNTSDESPDSLCYVSFELQASTILTYKLVLSTNMNLDDYNNIQFLGNNLFEQTFNKYNINSNNIILYFTNPFATEEERLKNSINFKMIIYK